MLDRRSRFVGAVDDVHVGVAPTNEAIDQAHRKDSPMPAKLAARDITFTYEPGDKLVRTVRALHRTYTHRCSLEDFTAVADIIGSPDIGPRRAIDIADEFRIPHTAVRVAIAFLDERSIIERFADGYWRPASTDVPADALTEFWALKEEAQP